MHKNVIFLVIGILVCSLIVEQIPLLFKGIPNEEGIIVCRYYLTPFPLWKSKEICVHWYVFDLCIKIVLFLYIFGFYYFLCFIRDRKVKVLRMIVGWLAFMAFLTVCFYILDKNSSSKHMWVIGSSIYFFFCFVKYFRKM